jgi:hypothetical protein
MDERLKYLINNINILCHVEDKLKLKNEILNCKDVTYFLDDLSLKILHIRVRNDGSIDIVKNISNDKSLCYVAILDNEMTKKSEKEKDIKKFNMKAAPISIPTKNEKSEGHGIRRRRKDPARADLCRDVRTGRNAHRHDGGPARRRHGLCLAPVHVGRHQRREPDDTALVQSGAGRDGRGHA